MAVYTFVADASNPDDVFTVSNVVLVVSFSRGSTTTINPDGGAVAADEARFDDERYIAAAPVYVEVDTSGGYLLASGVDHDGTTPLMVFLRSDDGKFRVFRGGSYEESTFRDRDAGPLTTGVAGFGDLFKDDAVEGELGLRPESAVIVHGAIILSGAVWRCVDDSTPDGEYELVGSGCAINQHAGDPDEWEWLFSDEGDPAEELYATRGARYCLKAAPIYQRERAHPDRCYLCMSDYIHKVGGRGHSGRAYYFRIKRVVTTSPPSWTFWDIERDDDDPMVKWFDIWDGAPDILGIVNHVHSVMATEWEMDEEDGGGVQLLISVGDTTPCSRFICCRMEDHTDDYTNDNNWTVIDNYHGVAETDPPSNPPVATASPQPVGTAFGSEPGQIIWGADLSAAWLFMTQLPLSAGSPDQAQFSPLYGFTTTFGISGNRPATNLFFINQPFPERAQGPLVANFHDENHFAFERTLYCPDASEPNMWAQVAAYYLTGINSHTTVLFDDGTHGPSIYFTGHSTSGHVYRVPVPSESDSPRTLARMRPVLVGCGGVNLLHANHYFDDGQQATVFEPIDVISGDWFDPLDSRQLPDPPVLGGKGLCVQTENLNAGSVDGIAGDIRVSSNSGSSWGSGWQLGTQVRRIKGWMLNGTYDRTSLVAPNKTTTISIRPGNGATFSGDGAPLAYVSEDRWFPFCIIMPVQITNPNQLSLRIYSTDSGADDSTDENYNYIVFASTLDGNGASPYELAPGATGPDELLTIEGMALSVSGSWTVKVAGMMPEGNWDHFAARGTFNSGTGQFDSNRRWPLLVLWGNDNNWIELSADCEGGGFRLRVRQNGGNPTTHDFGGANQRWSAGSPLLVAITQDAGTDSPTLRVGASLGAGPVQRFSGTSVSWSSSDIDELRFRGAPGGGHSAQGEVCEFRWFGGEINTSTTISYADLLSAFTDIDFLA